MSRQEAQGPRVSRPRHTPVSRRARIALVAAVALVATGTLVGIPWALWTMSAQPSAAAGPAAADDGPAPSYVLTDQNGRRVSSSRFAGTPLAGKVEIVAFNVDPDGASPARMRQFWSEFGGDPRSPGVEFL